MSTVEVCCLCAKPAFILLALLRARAWLWCVPAVQCARRMSWPLPVRHGRPPTCTLRCQSRRLRRSQSKRQMHTPTCFRCALQTLPTSKLAALCGLHTLCEPGLSRLLHSLLRRAVLVHALRVRLSHTRLQCCAALRSLLQPVSPAGAGARRGNFPSRQVLRMRSATAACRRFSLSRRTPPPTPMSTSALSRCMNMLVSLSVGNKRCVPASVACGKAWCLL